MFNTKAENFPMGKYGTVITSPPSAPIAEELAMLGRLIGTDSPQGRAEARGIVERVEADLAAILAALRGVLPYAESRLEDMEDSQEELDNGDEPSTPESLAESRECLERARAAFDAAKAVLAAAEGSR